VKFGDFPMGSRLVRCRERIFPFQKGAVLECINAFPTVLCDHYEGEKMRCFGVFFLFSAVFDGILPVPCTGALFRIFMVFCNFIAIKSPVFHPFP